MVTRDIHLSDADKQRFAAIVAQAKWSGECLEWARHRNNKGYGVFTIKRKPYLAHRVMWVANYGQIKDNKFVCHHCDNPACINIDHLFLGTHADNQKDKIAKGRQRSSFTKGMTHPNAKLTDSDVRAIRRSNKTFAELSIEYGIGTAQVSSIRNRQSWQHIA